MTPTNGNAPAQPINTAELLGSQNISEALLSMEKRVYLFKTTGALRSNRTGRYCDGLPSIEGWYESQQQANFAYCTKYPQTVATDLRGVWEVKTSCIME